MKMPLLKTNKNKAKKESQNLSELSMFDRAAKGIFSVLDSGYSERMTIGAKDQKFRNILNRELEISKGYSQGSIVDFVHSLKLNKQKGPFNMNQKNSQLLGNYNDLFTKNINDIFGYFQEMYRNRFIEIDDLKFIAKFIPALGEAVKTVLDAIVASDNIAETVNRKIELSSGISSEDKTAIVNEIERIEKELKLLKKLKSNVYKRTLVAGTHYVYAVPYNRIFQEFDQVKKKDRNEINQQKKNQFGTGDTHKVSNGKNRVEYSIAGESNWMLGDIDITPAMENMREVLSSSDPIDPSKKKLDKNTIEESLREFQYSLPEINYMDSPLLSEAMESVRLLYESPGAMEAFVKKKRRNKGYTYNPLKFDPTNFTPDGTKSTEYSPKPTEFNISGTYVKYIDAKNLIPLKVFDQVIGYYLLHPKAKKNRMVSTSQAAGISSIGSTLFSAVNIGETRKQDAVQRIVDSIAEGILNQFDKKFVSDFAEYKKLIADVIIANGLTDKDYNIQFIPADDIIPFTIQEGEDGFGESILSDSLFPAKLLLSMIVTRMLNYINKTGNKTIAHIHKGPINAYDTNQLNRVVRELQDQDITFNDLLSPNLVFNKFNRDGNKAIPCTQDDKKLVEFEIQEGQNIDMTPDYEKNLENMAIMGTGVPSVIMEYVGSADFAKQLVSANIKFAGRVASLQSDLEEPTTTLYKKLVENSNLTDDQKAICAQSLEIKLPRPRVLINSNNNEYIQNVIQASESIAELAIGRDTLTDEQKMPNGIRVKEKLALQLAMRDSPFIDWEEVEQLRDAAMIEVEEEVIKKKASDEAGGNNDGGMGDMNL